MEITRKSFMGIELKGDKPGSFTARFITLNVIDKDGDVTLPGAAPVGKTVLISAYQHGSWDGALPVGKGVIREDGDAVYVEGEFYLNTDAGKQHYETIKNAPEIQEWSYGFRITKTAEGTPWNDNPNVWRVIEEMDVFEVSPVLRGAGVNTACLAIKSEGTTLADHSEAVLTAVKELAERLKSLTEIRRKQGRAEDITKANRDRVLVVLNSLGEIEYELKALLVQPDKSEAQRLYLRCLKTLCETENI